MREYETIDYIEVVKAADEALYHLNKANKSLSSASNFGIWDMLGGGFFVSMMKRERMSNAQTYLEHAKIAIEKFKDELDDIDTRLDINIDDFNDMFDVWFDNAIVDVAVQFQISEAKKAVEKAIYVISKMKKEVEEMIASM